MEKSKDGLSHRPIPQANIFIDSRSSLCVNFFDMGFIMESLLGVFGVGTTQHRLWPCVKCEATRINIEIHIIYEVHQEFTMAEKNKKIPDQVIKIIKITYMCSRLGHMLCEGPDVESQAKNLELKQSDAAQRILI